jgi:hypothetical protein
MSLLTGLDISDTDDETVGPHWMTAHELRLDEPQL